jgi:hypothetical protein
LPREIIVVIDHNPALLARARERFPDAIVVENHEIPGLSGARNSGVAVAQGSLIVFLDDDAIAEPTWLERIVDCCEDPNVLGVGGMVLPIWQISPPAWFPEEFYWVIGCSYRGLPETLAPVRNPFGGSMCIRREVFAEVGGFCNGIGRDAARPMGCEETELCIRAQQRWPQRVFLYEPRARAHHHVSATRLRWSYFRARCYAEGQSKSLVARSVGARDGLAAEQAYTLKTLPRGVARGLASVLFHRDLTGLARAATILAGLAITTVGYLQGRVAWRGANGSVTGQEVRSLPVTHVATTNNTIERSQVIQETMQ